jgi:Asp-tRNA(Asn)/Glu-tRNA(Gln) amidotransferase A subunit family amidase
MVIGVADPSASSVEDTTPHSNGVAPSAKPSALYYSAADYRALYLKGELTPTAVAEAILPLIRRDLSPPGAHSIAFFDSRVDLVRAAAKASTLRYKGKRSLGPLDGVPTAIKDGEYLSWLLKVLLGFKPSKTCPNVYLL